MVENLRRVTWTDPCGEGPPAGVRGGGGRRLPGGRGLPPTFVITELARTVGRSAGHQACLTRRRFAGLTAWATYPRIGDVPGAKRYVREH